MIVTIFGGHRDGEEYNLREPLPQEYYEPGELPPAAFLKENADMPIVDMPVIKYRLEWFGRIVTDDDGNEIERRKWPVYMHPDINRKALR